MSPDTEDAGFAPDLPASLGLPAPGPESHGDGTAAGAGGEGTGEAPADALSPFASDGEPGGRIAAINVLRDLSPLTDLEQLGLLADLVTSGLPLEQDTWWGVEGRSGSVIRYDDREHAEDWLGIYDTGAHVVSRSVLFTPWQKTEARQ